MATDAEIRARGLLYVPKQKYLQNPYELPPEETPVSEGIVNTNAFNNNAGGGFYTDDNRITNQNYNPNPLQDARFSNEMSFVGAPKTDANGRNPGQVGYDPSTAGVSYNTRTEAMKNMEMNNKNNYYGLDEPEQSKFQQFVRNAPILGTGIKAVELGGKFLSKILPTSRRSYLENELSNQGVFVDDIGRIVQGKGDYNTAQNVMANYNASNITQETLDKRIKMINDTIKRKTKSYDIKGKDYTTTKSFEDLTKRIGALNEYGDINNIVNKDADFIKKNPKEEEEFKFFDDNIITRFLKKKKSSNTTTGTDTTGDNDGATTGSATTDGGAGQGIDISGAGTIRSSDNNFQGDSGPTTQQESDYGYGSDFGFAKGGRAGYFFGGRVNYKAGGRTDAGPNRTTASKVGVGQINESGQKVSGGNFNNNDNDGASDNPPVTVVNDNPIDISTVTKSVGDYNIPYGVEALMADKGKFKAVINPDEILDKNIGAEFTYDKGPFSIGAYADMDGDKSLNANYTRNNSNYSFDLNDGGGQLKFTRTFANGGLASIL